MLSAGKTQSVVDKGGTMRSGLTRITAAVAASAVAVLVVAMAVQAAQPSDPGSPPSLGWTPSTAGGFAFGLVGVGKTATQTFTLPNSAGGASSALTGSLTAGRRPARTGGRRNRPSLGPRKDCTVA